MNFAEQGLNAKGTDVCSEEKRKMVWMPETKIRFFMQMELEAYRKELDWLKQCYIRAVNDYPNEDCSPMPLLVPPGYHTYLRKRAEMAAKGILPPTLKIIRKMHYPLPVCQSPVLPHPESPPCSSLLPCTEPESSGDDRPRVIFSEQQTVDGSKEGQSGVPLAVEPDDMTGKHRDGEQVQLERPQSSEGEGKVVLDRAFPALKSPSAFKKLDKP